MKEMLEHVTENMINNTSDAFNELRRVNPLLTDKIENMLDNTSDTIEVTSNTIKYTCTLCLALFGYPVFKTLTYFSKKCKKEENLSSHEEGGPVNEDEFECGVAGEEHWFEE